MSKCPFSTRLSFSGIVSLFFMGCWFPAKGQFTNDIPVDFDQVEPLLYLRNPGYARLSDKFTAQIGYKGFNSLSNNLRTFYADFSLQLPRDSAKGHFVGFQSYVDQEGIYLRHNRLHMKYAYSLRLSSSYTLSLGASLGIINFSVLDNGAIGSLSTTRPDVKLGSYLQHKRWDLNGSVLQFLDQRILFETGELVLKRYYQGVGNYVFEAGPALKFKSGLFLRYARDYQTDVRLLLKGIYKDQVYAGASINPNNGFIAEAGLIRLPWNSWHVSVGLSFRQWLNNQVIRQANAMEITLGLVKLNGRDGLLYERKRDD